MVANISQLSSRMGLKWLLYVLTPRSSFLPNFFLLHIFIFTIIIHFAPIKWQSSYGQSEKSCFFLSFTFLFHQILEWFYGINLIVWNVCAKLLHRAKKYEKRTTIKLAMMTHQHIFRMWKWSCIVLDHLFILQEILRAMFRVSALKIFIVCLFANTISFLHLKFRVCVILQTISK